LVRELFNGYQMKSGSLVLRKPIESLADLRGSNLVFLMWWIAYVGFRHSIGLPARARRGRPPLVDVCVM
jgi:hypothetical protein